MHPAEPVPVRLESEPLDAPRDAPEGSQEEETQGGPGERKGRQGGAKGSEKETKGRQEGTQTENKGEQEANKGKEEVAKASLCATHVSGHCSLWLGEFLP